VDRVSGHPSSTEGLEPLPRRLTYGTLLGLVVVFMVMGGMGLSALAAPSSPAAIAAAPSPFAPAASTPSDITHGDLVVGAGETFTIQPTLGGRTYFQGGNVTVLSGGTLIVQNVTLSFVQFVSDSGTAQSRLSHIVHFLDQGTVRVYNSTITTDVNVLNAYPKLNLTVTGTFTAWTSTLAFPGWITSSGIGAAVTLNSSTLTSNPGVAGLSEPSVILGDSDYSASLIAVNGGAINLFNSTENATYSNNFVENGLATIAPLVADNITGVVNVTTLSTSTSPANLTRDWLNPQTAPAGNVSVWYNTTGAGPIYAVPVTVWYEGVAYPLASLSINGSANNAFASVAFSPALLAAINGGGLLNYLNNTGSFGGSSKISVSFGGPGAAFSSVRLAVLPNLDYDILATGGATVSTVDSNLDLTWTAPPVSPWSVSSPAPWLSNKLVLTNNAAAYLANLSVVNPIPGVFSTSAILPDDTSNAYFYRWANLNLTGEGGIVPIYGASEHAFYAYGSSQANNATVTSLNNLPATAPAIWGYVQYRDHALGYPGYGVSGRTGISSLLLASSWVTGTNTPDGNFLGTYHIGLLLPTVQNSSRWFNWSVSPFPVGVALGSPGYAGPDFGPNQHFPQYFAGAAFSGLPVVTANGSVAPTTGVRIGQLIGFQTTIVSTGPAPIQSLDAALIWGNSTATRTLGPTFSTTAIDLDQVGQTYTFNLTWVVNETVVGLNGTVVRNFTVAFIWNPGNVTGLSGVGVSTQAITLRPSEIVIASFTGPTSTTLDISQTYFSSGVVHYNGTQSASINLYATPSGGGIPILIAHGTSTPGTFDLTWYPLNQGGASSLNPGTSYTLQAIATYNGVNGYYNLTGVYTVPSTTSPTSFLTQTILGLPLWLWLVIAAAIVVGLVLFLVVLRRTAAGKVVECGECGNLIPEDATTCPKCGAEFEADLVRCSRCAATIPSNSAICPECAAVLLGDVGTAAEGAERQGYQDFTEKYRAEGKKELGENYNEGSFWDWWKRQPTYVSYSQWKLQQGQGSPRMGMSEPPATPPGTPLIPSSVPSAPSAAAAPAARPKPTPPAATAPAPRAPPPAAAPVATAPAVAGSAPAPAGGLKSCPTCGKEIPGDYLVCPFCGSVTQ
jgi:RNA polymerase subunit RPABC4/transcription elongation factor Spt4